MVDGLRGARLSLLRCAFGPSLDLKLDGHELQVRSSPAAAVEEKRMPAWRETALMLIAPLWRGTWRSSKYRLQETRRCALHPLRIPECPTPSSST
jgi:hypothetical protein